MQDLRVTLVQSHLHWEDAAENRALFTAMFKDLRGNTDLVVLPEMFTTGFTMRSRELAEGMDGRTVAWMKEQANLLDAALYGSAIIREGDHYYNRGLFVTPDGAVTTYDKRHLFRFANETDHYTAGNKRVVVEWRGWRILLQICFDLRFPVFARNRGDLDAILYVANWPEVRRYPWSHLLIARAIENQCHVIGVNRVGQDGNGHLYSGDSAAIDPRGAVQGLTPGVAGVLTTVFDRAALEDFRAKFPVALEADGFTLDQ
ncbi:MAG: amidohydrolase [Flavobacteriales bacterium]|jgi:predicted amidohydrolase|nr:amidohydrolase [Flavobacteriales bacterium]